MHTGTRSLRLNLMRCVLLAVILLAWEMASGVVIAEFFVSKPSAIARTLGAWVAGGNLFFHVGITALEAFAGFLVGASIGVVVGVVLGRIHVLAELLHPFILAFYSLPKIALAPLFILWLGIGIGMKITLTATVVFFLVFLNTYTGVRNVSRELESIMYLMGASERHVLTKVVLPSAITWVFAGLRISVPYALIGAIVGELDCLQSGTWLSAGECLGTIRHGRCIRGIDRDHAAGVRAQHARTRGRDSPDAVEIG